MKKALIPAFGIVFLLATATNLSAQLSAKIENCNDIKAEFWGSQKKGNNENYAYILERSIAPDIWMSVQKNFNKDNSSSFLALPEGTYRVKYTRNDDRKTKVLASEPIKINKCYDLDDFNQVKLTAVPNPSSGIVNIFLEGASYEGTKRVDMLNAQGVVVRTIAFENTQTTTNVSTLPKGLYILTYKTADNNVSTERLIVN